MERALSDLKTRMIEAAGVWCKAHGAPLSRIGKQVAGDAAFFARMERPDATCTVTTLERFAGFLADGGNWPEGRVPQDVVDFVHVVGISAQEERDHAA